MGKTIENFSYGYRERVTALYSTRQIAASIYGSMHVEKLATQREITRKLELENAITTASVLNRAALQEGFTQLADSLVQVVMSSPLPRKTREDFLRNLSSWRVIVTNVARNQSKLPNGKGPRQEEEQSES
jgi:hypothetical protein